ncbi:diguanylate cyclase [Thiomicrospira microaerophila]|uniref:diguanylate cyclase n=1 Tax=Thiomicrospira microaerophila TaxID=406020 RepID=UPI00200E7CF4|nr:transporter substrate-binding domain-containing protein [Thiomicrospira microaerophila]UQB42075.1 diguanylate cyclase [Thiomicrospira microaerophila]
MKRFSLALAYFPLILCLVIFSRTSIADETPTLVPVSVQINWHHQFQFAGFYAAKAKGFYQEAGLDVTIKSWQPGINITNEVASGRATFGTAYSSALVDYIKGQPIQAVMTSFQYSPMVLLSKEPITELSQLSGKTVTHYNNLQVLALLTRAEKETAKSSTTLPPTGDLADFIEGRVDLYGAYETNEPYQLDELGEAYYLVKPSQFGINSMEDLVIVSRLFNAENPDLVDKFREATIAGWEYAIQHQEEIVDYIIKHYPLVKSRQALLYEARATTKYVRTGTTPIGAIEPARLIATAAEARDIGQLSQHEFSQFNPQSFVARSGSSLDLTREERVYLVNNPVIRIGNDIDWEPFEFIDKNGQFSGMAADYFALFEQRLGVKFEPVKDKIWSEVMAMARNKEVVLLSAAAATPERERFLRFTQPYMSFPMVLVGTGKTFFINDYSELTGKKVAVVKDYWSHEYIRDNYPGIDLYLVNSVSEGLEAVLQGDAYVYSGNLAVINFILQQRGMTGLRVVGQADQRFELAIGVQKDDPLLFSIMQKTLYSITQAEHDHIYGKWIRFEMVQRLDTKQLIQLVLIVSGLLLMMLAWGLSYRYQKKRLQRYVDQVHELTYASLIDAQSYKVVWASRRYCELTGYSLETLQQTNFMDLAGPDMSSNKLQAIAKQVLSGHAWSGEMEGRTKDGKVYWVELTLSPQKNYLGKVTEVWATRVNISDKKIIEELSIKDELTGIFNRRYLNQVFDAEIGRIRRKKGLLNLALFDLDYFKHVNDQYGHLVGDQVLKAVTECAARHFNRGEDYLFRMGGEEFLIMTNGLSNDEFKLHLDRFRQSVVDLNVENKGTELGVVSISIGALAWQAEKVKDFTLVYKHLDDALYLAKAAGRNRIEMGDN